MEDIDMLLFVLPDLVMGLMAGSSRPLAKPVWLFTETGGGLGGGRL